jgi:hypothetical protein
MMGCVSINTGYLALNGNKIEHFMSSTMKCIGKINTFSNTGPHKVVCAE